MSLTGIVPFKTPQGLDELARRTRRLGQRHRTVLLLVDGRRSVDQVLALALAAGVGEQHYRELLGQGLIALPDGATTAPTLPAPLDEAPQFPEAADTASGALHVELPLPSAEAGQALAPLAPQLPPSQTTAEPAASAPAAAAHDVAGAPAHEPAAALAAVATPAPPEIEPARLSLVAPLADESLLPSAQSLLPDSLLGDTLASAHDDLMPPVVDGPLEEAREILIRAVRSEAPVAGRLTVMKLKRASDRAEIESLLDEVETRISRPRKMIVAAQTLRHVRHLLCMPPSTAFTMY